MHQLHITGAHSERQAPLRQLIATTNCPLTRQLATDKLSALTREENRHRVQLSLSRETAARSISLTHRTPIPCGLRNARNNPGFKQDEHWFFSRLTEKEAKRLQRIVDEWCDTFATSIDKSLALALAGAGKTLKQAFKQWELTVFLDLPEAVRKGPHAQKIKEVVEKKIRG